MKRTTARTAGRKRHGWALAALGLLLMGPRTASAQSAPEWKTYPLRHHSATAVQGTVEQMLLPRDPTAQVVADGRGNLLHVRALPTNHGLAAQLVQTLDVPQAAAPVAGAQPVPPEVKAYAYSGTDLTQAAARLQSEFEGRSDVRIAADARGGRILAVAPADLQERIARRIGSLHGGGNASTRGTLEGNLVRMGPPFSGDESAREPQPRALPGHAATLRPSGMTAPANRAPSPVPRDAYPQTPAPTYRAARQLPPAAPQGTAPGGAPGAVPPGYLPPAPAAHGVGGVLPAGPLPPPRGALVSLESTPWPQVVAGLQGLWGARLVQMADPHPEMAHLRYTSPQGETLDLQIHRRSHQIAVDGPPALAGAAFRLVQMLDRPPQQPGQATRVVGYRNARPAKIQQAVLAYQGEKADGSAPRPAEPPKPVWRSERSPLVSQIFRQRENPNAGVPGRPEEEERQPQQPPPEEPEVDQDFRGGTFGQVQIDYVEGLDAFVIRGSEKDVQKLQAIIDDLERLSGENEPLIEVYLLKHVAGEPLTDLTRQLYDEILGQRLGRVSITALTKPNAVLLIGQPDSIKVIKELIQRLDQPVGPGTQFEVFRLKHLSADAARTTITEFYANRVGMGVRVQVSADFRTNSLLVQAAPRDMAEVSLLLKRIDTDENEAVNELRMFKLQNSLADQMAILLQNAVSGGQRTGTTGAAGLGVAGAGAQPAGGTSTAASNRSTTLRFLTVDPQGRQVLRSGILTDVKVTADVRANTLLVSAPADSMELIAALVRELDRIPVAETQLKVFTIVNGDAASLTTMLEQLFGTAQQAGGFGGFGGGGLGGLGGQQSQTLVPLRFSADTRTNSVIASGSTDDLQIVEAILLRLDGSDVQDRKTEVFRLKNSPATDVSNAINQYLQNERAVQQTNPALTNAFEQIEREVVVVPEPVSNSLIVSATPRFFDEIKKLVDQLDARPPMVLIQVLIAEIALDNVDEFGIELGLQDSVLFDRGVVTNNQIAPGYNFNNFPLGNGTSGNPAYVGGQGLTNFAMGRTNSELQYGGLVLGASSENVSILMRALKECRRVDVLSRPQIQTLDNQPAFIQVGQRVPRITGSTTNQNGQTNSTVLEHVGLILGVTPRISPDNLVVMEVDAERSEVGAEADGIPVSVSPSGQIVRSPRINTTTAQTTVSAMSGQTILLGGLLTKRTDTVHRTVPVLGSIPVLKNFFRYDLEKVRRTELMIILTPHIVRSEADGERLKQQESARMSWCLADVEKLQGEAGLRSRLDTLDETMNETNVIYGGQLPPGAKIVESPEGETVPGVPFYPEEGGSGVLPLMPVPTPPADARGPQLDGTSSRRSIPRKGS